MFSSSSSVASSSSAVSNFGVSGEAMAASGFMNVSSDHNNNNNNNDDDECFPSSVEEAGALLGATLTRFQMSNMSGSGGAGKGVGSSSSVLGGGGGHAGTGSAMMLGGSESHPPPRGMHSAFSVVHPVPSTELVTRLHALRALLRTEQHQQNMRVRQQGLERVPMVSAPSLLAVLMKLLGLSTSLATHPPPSGAPAPTAGPSSSSSSTASATLTSGGLSGATSGFSQLQQQQQSTSQQQQQSSAAAAANAASFYVFLETPPMLSTPLRHLWVDCVVLCHVLGAGLTGSSKITTTTFIRKMLEVASINPRSQKAAGGVRLAALNVIAALFQYECSNAVDQPWLQPYMQKNRSITAVKENTYNSLVAQLAPWSLDVLQVCLKALKSAGNGEPTYRLAALETAQGTALASQMAFLKNHPGSGGGGSPMVLQGAYEDKAIQEAVKLVKQAATDKFPEVRSAAARYVAQVAPLLFHHPSASSSSASGGLSSPAAAAAAANTASPEIASLDDLLMVCLKNLDDESPYCAHAWAVAAARCINCAIHFQQQNKAAARGGGSPDDAMAAADGTGTPTGGSAAAPSRFAIRRTMQQSSTVTHQHCGSLVSAVLYLVDRFVNCGGELVASRCGGTYSTGGRSVRIGFSLILMHLLQLQYQQQQNGPAGGAASGSAGAVSQGGAAGATGAASSGLALQQTVELILKMLGSDMERQLTPASSASSASKGDSAGGVGVGAAVGVGGVVGGGLFSSNPSRNRTKGDASLVRLAACRVLRQGIAERASEPTQLALLHLLIGMIMAQHEIAKDPTKPATSMPLNANQLQVVLVEVSHLLTALGEAAASTVPDFMDCIGFCVSYRDHGVRHEAAIACEAFCFAFPTPGRKLLKQSLDEIQMHHAEMNALAAMKQSASSAVAAATAESSAGLGLRGMFMRGGGAAAAAAAAAASQEIAATDAALPQQYAIHGKSLMVSLLVRDLPGLAGGIPCNLMTNMVSVAEILVGSQFHEGLAAANPGGVCMCVRAGFAIISGILATGPNGAARHMPLIVGAWQNCVKSAASTGSMKGFHPRHELFCLDGALASIEVFLKYCADLLLSVPGALSQVSSLLEDSLKVLMPSGRLGSMQLTPAILARLESAIASLLECFAWLPSGSFPMAADDVFTLAANHIRSSIENEVPCSILKALVNKEDSLLDSKTWSRASRDGQLGGARDVEATIVSLTAEAVLHGEREAVIHLLNLEDPDSISDNSRKYLESSILGAFACDLKETKVPTPLHEVGGCWRRPVEPSCSANVRLVDAAIQAYSASFGLKSGKEQQDAMDMLESLVPPLLAQLARTIGINTVLIEPDRRAKSKDDSVGAAVINITAVLLSCLQALPLQESTRNLPIGLGPQWMNKAKDLLLTLLPSSSTIVRRAAAEGLALLATVGNTDDAHFLQSAVLHSLDEVMQGNQPDGKPNLKIAFEPISAARSGSLLTLACIQRTAHLVSERKLTRARERTSSRDADDMPRHDDLPVLQMMTRTLPSSMYHGKYRDFFIVRTYALHSFCVLLNYSGRLEGDVLDHVDEQLLKKTVELIEGNFVASWVAASVDADRGQEAEKMASEVAFLSVLLRLMTFVATHLRHLRAESARVAHRFSVIAALILESHSAHPVVAVEAMAFFEVLSSNRDLLPASSPNVIYTEQPLYMAIPFVLNTQVLPQSHTAAILDGLSNTSVRGCRAAVRALESLTLANIHVSVLTDKRSISILLAALEVVCGCRYFFRAGLLRSLAVSQDQDAVFKESVSLEKEMVDSALQLLPLERSPQGTDTDSYLRTVLLARSLLSGGSTGTGDDDEDEEDDKYTRVGIIREAAMRGAHDASVVLMTSNSVRWQVKTLASKLAFIGLDGLCQASGEDKTNFDLKSAYGYCAKVCREAKECKGETPSSKLVLHLEELIASACISSAATLDHSELRALQGSSIVYLEKLITSFMEIRDPENPQASILEQYATQILSAVKHSLGETEEIDSSDGARLFQAGCEVLEKIVQGKLSRDPAALKRMIRPVIPSFAETPFFSFADGIPGDLISINDGAEHKDSRVAGLIKISKLSATAVIFSGSTPNNSLLESVGRELISNELGIAVHCAAVAMDGVRLLLGAGVSLAGIPFASSEGIFDVKTESGFLFKNIQDIDDSVKCALTMTWSSSANYALSVLLQAAISEDTEPERKSSCIAWISEIVPFLIAGIHHADDALSMELPQSAGVAEWAACVDPLIVKVDCLRAIGSLVRLFPPGEFKPLWKEDIEATMDRLRESIILPLLGGTSRRENVDPLIATEVCSLLSLLAASDSDNILKDSSLLISLLTPLDCLQKGNIDFDRPEVEKLVSTCTLALGSYVSHNKAQDSLVLALLELALKCNARDHQPLPTEVKNSFNVLLRNCLVHKSITRKQVCDITLKIATDDDWESWAIVAGLDDGRAGAGSFEIVRNRLRLLGNAKLQLRVLSTVRELAQGAKLQSPMLSRLSQGLGPDMIGILHQYGTLRIPPELHINRTTVCTDSLKFLLVAYQQVSGAESQEDIASFLSILLDVLLAVVRFNGLPNHPSPNAGGDMQIGRMMAQTIVMIAKTTPVPFKVALTGLADHDRTLLEFTVRAEMTGYQTANAPKRKLDLKSFKK